MIQSLKKYISRHVFPSPVKEKGVVEAYDIWAANYDAQPGNLMLDLDEKLFAELLTSLSIKNKKVADIGCGTGRHWHKLLAKNPASLAGFDVSPGMLNQLKHKFPQAETHVITDNLFSAIADKTYDVIVSTLTVAHIENIEEALVGWIRILKDDGNIIITDFHPDILASGGQRTFKHQKEYIAVKNHVHKTDTISEILLANDFVLVNEIEKVVDESLMHYYENQDALHVYEKYKGYRVIYGLHFRRVK